MGKSVGEVMQLQLDQLMTEIKRAKFKERRTEQREPCTRPVSIYYGDDQLLTAFTKNVSRQGVAIISSREWHPGEIATVRIHSLERFPLCFRCEVRWSEPYGDGWFVTGWKFMSATPATRTP
ncbi:MAG: hypothetical protein Fues2KO_42180 [Fuerstiella sp.]